MGQALRAFASRVPSAGFAPLQSLLQAGDLLSGTGNRMVVEAAASAQVCVRLSTAHCIVLNMKLMYSIEALKVLRIGKAS